MQEQVDAIVNGANEDLKHIGGLAKAIPDAGGPTIQSESDEYTRTCQGQGQAREGCMLGGWGSPLQEGSPAKVEQWATWRRAAALFCSLRQPCSC